MSGNLEDDEYPPRACRRCAKQDAYSEVYVGKDGGLYVTCNYGSIYDMDGYTFTDARQMSPGDWLCDECLTRLGRARLLWQHYEYGFGGPSSHWDRPPWERGMLSWLRRLLRGAFR